MNDNFLKSMPRITKILLITNVVVFILALLVPILNRYLALYYFQSPLFKPYQMVTHIFMHGGFSHLLFNMYALVVFGSVIEKKLDEKQYLFLYFFSALGAFLLHMGVVWFQLSDVPSEVLTQMQTEGADLILSGRNYSDAYLGGINAKMNTAMVGASGALMGILAAFAYFYPNAELSLMFFPVPLKAKFFIPLFMVIELFLGVKSFEWDNVAHFAHFGGAIFGFIAIRYFFKVKK